MPVRIEMLTRQNFCEDALDGFIRHQEVTECWRLIEGRWQLVPIAFVEEWNHDKLRGESAMLLKAIADGRSAFGAFRDDVLIGFAQLGERLGSRGQYIELVSFHVSAPYRGQGIGRRLFAALCCQARKCDAEKLYISAHSSRESQAAYRALGCVHAMEISAEHAAQEPFDVQMEYDLRRMDA